MNAVYVASDEQSGERLHECGKVCRVYGSGREGRAGIELRSGCACGAAGRVGGRPSRWTAMSRGPAAGTAGPLGIHIGGDPVQTATRMVPQNVRVPFFPTSTEGEDHVPNRRVCGVTAV